MKIQRIWTGEPLESGDFREVRSLTAPEGRIPSANTQRKALSHALTPTGASCRVKTFPPALAQARAVVRGD
ncbi:hypothetical protein APY94_08980 [Thermococcus celericrescens]|uniref:Uncharacterized protein n=1 Tax=Thermococcus celericrescens TaxID=227598 RepID=A0A100XX01_9EURY|nr:hypothetical protein APY94_08980 [Thermococcus celericrescens]